MRMKKMTLSRRSGFSLIEILVVIMIISVLATVVTISVLSTPNEGKKAATVANIKNLQTALESYSLANGLPSQNQGLQALVEEPTLAPVPKNWKQGGYLNTSVLPEDGWGNPFVYLIPARDGKTAYEIISYGADGEPGGTEFDADISSAVPTTFAND